MNTKYLMPHGFKKTGLLIFPLGLAVWIISQLGLLNGILASFNFRIPGLQIILVISFFSFLAGLFFSVFSKEKKEDEFIASLRLQTFQLSAIVQLIFFIIAFLAMLIFRIEPRSETGFMLFLLFAIFLFWIFYIIRFNYILHWKKNDQTG